MGSSGSMARNLYSIVNCNRELVGLILFDLVPVSDELNEVSSRRDIQ